MNVQFFIIIATLIVCSFGVDLDPDVTLNRKLDPSLKDSAQVLPNFRAIFDGKDTQVSIFKVVRLKFLLFRYGIL